MNNNITHYDSWKELYAAKRSSSFNLFLSRTNQKEICSKIIFNLLKKLNLNIHRNISILDIGSGEGTIVKYLIENYKRDKCERVKIVAVDPSRYMINKMKKNMRKIKNIEWYELIYLVDSFPVNDSSEIWKYAPYNMIILSHVLFWIENISSLFDQLISAMSDDGMMITAILSKYASKSIYNMRRKIIKYAYDNKDIIEDTEKLCEILENNNMNIMRIPIITESRFEYGELFKHNKSKFNKESIELTDVGVRYAEFLSRKPWNAITKPNKMLITKEIYKMYKYGRDKILSSEEIIVAEKIMLL